MVRLSFPREEMQELGASVPPPLSRGKFASFLRALHLTSLNVRTCGRSLSSSCDRQSKSPHVFRACCRPREFFRDLRLSLSTLAFVVAWPFPCFLSITFAYPRIPLYLPVARHAHGGLPGSTAGISRLQLIFAYCRILASLKLLQILQQKLTLRTIRPPRALGGTLTASSLSRVLLNCGPLSSDSMVVQCTDLDDLVLSNSWEAGSTYHDHPRKGCTEFCGIQKRSV